MTCEARTPDCPTFPIEGASQCLDVADHSHDTFIFDEHKNFLVNSAGLGIYIHGRIHQEENNQIFVSDLIHKRGYLETDDILLMEEQSLPSYGDPLCTSTTMGKLMAMAIMPRMNSANGEGDLIGYYEGGVVAYDTFKFPRETREDGEGNMITKGWDTQRLINHLLNTVSAVGPKSVAVMPRDHFFRSTFGLHFLNFVTGEGTLRTENTNLVSQGIQPLLDLDKPDVLRGAACGMWIDGKRLFATFGLERNEDISPTTVGRGFVSMNQATTYTEDRTPIQAWEGAWMPDSKIIGIHQFDQTGLRPTEGSFGFLCSDEDKKAYFASIESKYTSDFRDGEWLPIESGFVTAKISSGDFSQLTKLTDGFIEGEFSSDHHVQILVRTDLSPQWGLWKEFDASDKELKHDEMFIRSENLGQPDKKYREASWFQFKFRGSGYAKITSFFADISKSGNKPGQNRCSTIQPEREDYLSFNKEPKEKRWQI